MSTLEINEKTARQRNAHYSDEEQAIRQPHTSANSRDHLTVPVAAADEQDGRSDSTHPRSRFSYVPSRQGLDRFKHRFLRTGKRTPGVVESLRAIAFSSWVNVFIVFIPISWVAHFSNANNSEDPERTWPFPATFTLCLLAIIPLERLFDFGGEQMAFYLGRDLGDLLVVTLNNAVEATLAIILLTKCELRILQSTIIGVIILHLLLVPGTAFIVGGARVMHQDLHPHLTQLNHSLLVMGVLSLLLPAAFFASLDRGTVSLSDAPNNEYILNDATRHTFLTMSRGLAIILLAVYVASRIFLHDPPGEDNAFSAHPDAPLALLDEEEYLIHGEPEVSQWVCIGVLAVTIAFMAATAEWLVDSIEFVREEGGIQEEWFGLILLPIVSYAADGLIAIVYFCRYTVESLLGVKTPPATLAKARAIDLSIQFILFWMPFIVLLGWWTNRPISLLFDFFEVAIVIGACFLVNYVTADAKTNWAEGFAMVSFYVMIALTTWFYTGETEIRELLNFGRCFSDVQSE